MAVIRRAVPRDADDVVGLVREFYELDGHHFDARRVLKGLAPLLVGDEHGQVWLVVDGGLVGYAVVTWGWSLESGGRDALLDEIYLRVRGAGIGLALLTHARMAAALAGASRMFLETESHNDRVRAFYARSGFTADDSIWMSRDIGPL
ncbi:GNAT family N-acetyltransferase [Actinocrispum wychmicini]|nr:GNAT family N-acetyltransferase [Actinocrispum wychmicini]